MPDLVLYDGVCGLCNRLVRFILKRDRRRQFRFASLQGPLAEALLRRHGFDARDLDTFYLVADHQGPGEQVFARARAVLVVLRKLGGIWAVSRAFAPLPSRWLDAAYDFVAARRYRWFGRADACPLPPPEHRAMFLDG